MAPCGTKILWAPKCYYCGKWAQYGSPSTGWHYFGKWCPLYGFLLHSCYVCWSKNISLECSSHRVYHSPKFIPIGNGIPSWMPNLGWNSKLNTDSNWNSKLNSWSVRRVFTLCDLWKLEIITSTPYSMHCNPVITTNVKWILTSQKLSPSWANDFLGDKSM